MKLVVGALAVVLLCSGCGDAPGVEPTVTPTATVAPSATPTPVVELSKPTVAELVLSPEGLGPLVVGQAPPAGDPERDILIYSTTVCQAAVDEGYRDTADMWVANYEPALSGNDVDPFGAWVEAGELEALAVYNEAIRTAEGIHLGSTAAEVTAAYGGRLELVDDRFDTHLYRLAGVAGDLYIDVLKAESVASYPEFGGEVVVRLNVAIKGEVVPSFNSDYGLGRCIFA
jgi:hypothetical protein